MTFINLRVGIGLKNIQGKTFQLAATMSEKLIFYLCRPDSSNSFDWFSERQTKVLRYIRTFLQANSTAKDPRAVNQTRIMYQACMDTGNLI